LWWNVFFWGSLTDVFGSLALSAEQTEQTSADPPLNYSLKSTRPFLPPRTREELDSLKHLSLAVGASSEPIMAGRYLKLRQQPPWQNILPRFLIREQNSKLQGVKSATTSKCKSKQEVLAASSLEPYPSAARLNGFSSSLY
jgi:hypothetical protein